MLEYEAAVARIIAQMPAVKPELIPVRHAHRRILASPVLAPIPLPPFDNSAMDGYAVRAVDTLPDNCELRITGRVNTGESANTSVEPGCCARIFTGAALPPGADAVIMQEDTRLDPEKPGIIRIVEGVKPWENVRFRGEDIAAGAPAGVPGVEISLGHLNLFAALGISQVTVGRRPSVGILATGSELRESDEILSAGGIFESNRAGLTALFQAAGAVPQAFPLVKDTLADTQAALECAFDQSDLVVTSGGVSVGELDFVKSAFQAMGGEMEFWKIAMRPGKPFVFGRWREKFLFGLPGNPVSAFVTALLLVRPALRRWQGAITTSLPPSCGILADPLENPGSRRHFVRVTLDENGMVRPAGTQASHILSSLAAANGLVDVPPAGTLAAGSVVRVIRWE